MLKVGLIGCGGVGAIHARCWLAMGESVKLTAIADNNVERVQKIVGECGATIYTNGVILLEQEELDVVDICLPTFLHAEYVLKAMEHVKNVIVEKPVCMKEEEVQQLLEKQEQTGALVQVAHVVRFTDAYRYLKELVDARKYGKAITGNFKRISPRPTWMKGHDDMDRTGGMALDLHIHDVDYIRYLMGREPEDIKSWMVRDENGVIQHIWSSYHFGESILTAEGSWDYPSGFPFAQTFRVRLEKAAVVLDENGVLTVYPEEGDKFNPKLGEKEIMDLGINVSDLGPYMNEIRYFVETIQSGNQKGIASLEEAAASFRLVRKELQLADKA